ncbi:MAG: transcription termination/antitermination protein NusG [Myxococcota bacterium]
MATLKTNALKWYVVHTYSGFEEQAKQALQERIRRLDMADKFGEIFIPTETVEQFRGGIRRSQVRPCFSGYILVQMDWDKESAHVVRETPKITDFVGSRQRPPVLLDAEVERMRNIATKTAEAPRLQSHYHSGDTVRVIDGPFTNFSGSVEDVNEDKKRVKVLVSIFGRSTPVELDYGQVERVS